MTLVWRTNVSLQHFAGLVVSRGVDRGHRVCGSTVGCKCSVQRSIVPPSGIEPEPLGLATETHNLVRERDTSVARTAKGRARDDL